MGKLTITKWYYLQKSLPPSPKHIGGQRFHCTWCPGFVDLNGMDIMVHVNDCKPEDLETSSNMGQGWSWDGEYLLVMTNIAIEKGHLQCFVVSFPMKHGKFPLC